MKSIKLVVGDLVARTEAPTVPYRVTSKFHGKARGAVRVLPYRRSGQEQILFPIQYGGKAIWTDGGSQWLVVGHD
jgi:hypothetical protein